MSHTDVTYRGLVHQWHCDHMGHMNVMWYVGKFDEATWNLGAMMGMTSRYMKDAQRGMAAVDQRICYRREALVGDVLTIRSAVLEVKPRSVRFVHEMVRDQRGDLLAVMIVTGVHIDVRARKSVEFEPHIFDQSRARLAPDVTRWDRWPPERAYLLEDVD